MDTIFALSSGMPPAAIAIVRISGARAIAAAEAIAGTLPAPRRASLRQLRDPADGSILDSAIVLWFPAGRSATGEALVELHLHGGRAVVRAVERVLRAVAGLRAAEPGEFTRRALMNGRIDLTEAEGLGDLLMAETDAQRRAALAMSGGAVREQVARWTGRLLELAAAIEAELDFADEDDVSPDRVCEWQAAAAALAGELAQHLAEPEVERLREGISVVLAGPPNAGKSTLLNALVGREVAIVSPIPGTTRDLIEISVERNGVAYSFIDTAGLTETDDAIEAIGVARARAAQASAQIVLWLGEEAPALREAIWLFAKADIRVPDGCDERLNISADTGAGMLALWQAIEQQARSLLPDPGKLGMNRRQRETIGRVLGALTDVVGAKDPLLVAEHLRTGLSEMHGVSRAPNVEAILDTLFARFCIGK